MRVVFCLPGKQFSGRFIRCWSDLLIYCERSGLDVAVRNVYSSNVYLGRNLILRNSAEDMLSSALPLEGEKYDYLMWIDSDMVFTPKDFRVLVEHDVPIVSGIARAGPKQRLAAGHISEDHKLEWYDVESIKKVDTDEKGLIDVDFTGFAWVLMQYGVFESMPYPWFRPVLRKHEDKLFFPSEDIGWCMTAKKYGWDIKVDPEVRIGHEKSVVL